MEAQETSPKSTEYSAVETIFNKHCLDCHASNEPEGKLVMETFELLMKGGQTGPALVPGRSAESLLVRMIEGRLEKDGKKLIMPPGKRTKLEPTEIALIKSWIDAGAPPPQEPAAPREVVAPKITPTVPPRRAIHAVAFAPDPKLLAIARYGEVELRSTETRRVVRALTGHSGSVNALTFSADGKQLAAAAGEPALFGEARLWNTAEGTALRTFRGHRDALYSVALSPDGKMLATGSYDQKIKLWNVETGEEIRTLSAHNGAIFDLVFRPDGKILASASADRTVKLWEVATGKRVETLSQSLKELYAVLFSLDGKRLFAGGVDNRIRVWDISEAAAETTNPLQLSKFAHEGAILNLALSADGKTLLSSADDRTVKLWDARTVTERLSIETQPDVPPGLAFLADDQSFAVGRLDGTLELYDVKGGKPLPPLKPALTRVEPRGIQRGLENKLRLVGTNLFGLSSIKFGHEKLSGELLPGDEAKPHEAWIKVSAAADLGRGAYELWGVSPGGETAKIKLHVDDLPQRTEAEGQAARLALTEIPAACWGTLDPMGDTDPIEVEARAGEILVFDLAAKSLGSKAEAVLTLSDAQGKVLASSSDWDGGDALLAYPFSADGCYIVQVHDLLLGASLDHYYRLTIGPLPFVTGYYPLSVPVQTESEIELIGFNLPAARKVQVKAEKPGELELPLDVEKFRARKKFKLIAGDLPERLEIEPNDTAAQATALIVPGAANGRIWKEGRASRLPNGPDGPSVNPALLSPGTGGTPVLRSDVDHYRFEAKAGPRWIIETSAAQRGSPVDTRLEVLHPDGRPVQRLLLQAVRNSAITFRGIDSSASDARVENWEEMEINEYLYLQGEVVQIFRMPQGPDSGFVFYTSAGKRRAFFDTSAAAHALDAPCYVVEPRPLGSKLAPNGLPVFTLHYANDDDGERKLGVDSKLQFTAPQDGAYIVRVTDTQDGEGERFAYRLVIREVRPDFKVTLQGANPTVGPGSGQTFSVSVDRIDGFEGEVKIDITDLPPGFRASTPLVIQAGHSEAKGTLNADADAPAPMGTNAAATKVTATAVVNGKALSKDVNNFGTIKLGDKPKLLVALEPPPESSVANTGARAGDSPLDLTIAPGQTIPAWLRIRRNGHDDLVTFFVENLPHGVIVADIGLNGVLIPKGENEREIFLSAAKWVPETDRLCYAIENQAGRQTSQPVLLKVRKPEAKVAATPK